MTDDPLKSPTDVAKLLITMVILAAVVSYAAGNPWLGIKWFAIMAATVSTAMLINWWSPFSPRTWYIRAVSGGLLMASNLAPMGIEFPRLPLWAAGCALLAYSAREYRSIH
jgi:hypothetical protein